MTINTGDHINAEILYSTLFSTVLSHHRMQNLKNTVDKNKPNPQVLSIVNKDETRAKLEKLCKCDRISSESEIADFGEISKFNNDEKNAFAVGDKCDDDLEAEYLKLRNLLELPHDTHSLTKIETHLPPCLNYGFRSGLTHMNMQKFSPLTRGYQVSSYKLVLINGCLFSCFPKQK